ncbi:unnamed protein product [Diamesa hyperborea]
MEDARNFRSIYYEKVGCRSVEEKKSLEILLKESPVNKIKLKQFLQRFNIPTIHRGLLYNLALGVYPIYMDSKPHVMIQRRAVYDDLHRALTIMKYIDGKTSKNKVFHAMWLLENKSLLITVNIEKDTSFSMIANVLLESLESEDVDIYFLAKSFYRFSEEIEKDLPKLIQLTLTLLEKEDNDLYNILNSRNILQNLPFDRWYPTFFSSVLNDLALIRIFDKICGGSIQIVVFVFLVLCSLTKFNLKVQKNTESAVKVIEDYVDTETSDVICNKVVEKWHKFNLRSNK